MFDALKKPLILLACLSLLGAGAAIAVAAKGGGTTSIASNAAETQYGKPGGCTPGFWKNHPELWGDINPNATFDSVFGVKKFGSLTLLEAAGLGGGGYNALARHAVAALLNASNPHIDYGLSADEIIAMVQKAIKAKDPEPTKNAFEALNERGCPIDAHGNPVDD
jgi:hypothetical protein